MSEDVEARPTAASATAASTTAESATPSTAGADTTATPASTATSTAATPAPGHHDPAHHDPVIHHDQVPAQGRYHHGASPAGWGGALPALVGVFIAAIGGTVPHFHPVIFGIGAALFVLGGIAAIVLRALGLGND